MLFIKQNSEIYNKHCFENSAQELLLKQSNLLINSLGKMWYSVMLKLCDPIFGIMKHYELWNKFKEKDTSKLNSVKMMLYRIIQADHKEQQICNNFSSQKCKYPIWAITIVMAIMGDSYRIWLPHHQRIWREPSSFKWVCADVYG